MKPFICIASVMLLSCGGNEKSDTSGADSWIKGNEEEKFKTIEKQFRGF